MRYSCLDLLKFVEYFIIPQSHDHDEKQTATMINKRLTPTEEKHQNRANKEITNTNLIPLSLIRIFDYPHFVCCFFRFSCPLPSNLFLSAIRIHIYSHKLLFNLFDFCQIFSARFFSISKRNSELVRGNLISGRRVSLGIYYTHVQCDNVIYRNQSLLLSFLLLLLLLLIYS